MGTTADKLNKILESKAAIKAAIEAKGVSDVGDVLAEYPDKIASISGGGGGKFVVPDGMKFGYSSVFDATQFDTSQVTDMRQMFSSYRGKSLDLSELDTSNVTSMAYMFSSGQFMTDLNISNFDTSKVTNMSYMFEAYGGDSLDLSKWDVSNVTDVSYMFYNVKCSSIDLSCFNTGTSKISTIGNMFYGCRNLISIDLSNFNNPVSSFPGFYNCSKLESLDLSSFNTSKIPAYSNLFYSCTSLVNLKLNDIGHYESRYSNPFTLDLTPCENLSKESVLFLFNNAFDRKAEGFVKSFTIKLNATTKALLTDDEIAIATNKGFTVV